jgi:hypothetical protein
LGHDGGSQENEMSIACRMTGVNWARGRLRYVGERIVCARTDTIRSNSSQKPWIKVGVREAQGWWRCPRDDFLSCVEAC